MRTSTHRKLFDEGECRTLWTADSQFGDLTLAIVNGRTVLIHDYKREEDGFEVYIQTKGLSVDSAREQMGLTAR